MTLADYLHHRITIRRSEELQMPHGAGRLFSAWAVMQAARLEKDRLDFHRREEHQQKYRMESRIGLFTFGCVVRRNLTTGWL